METFFANNFLFGEDILNNLHIFAGSWLDMVMLAVTSMGSEIFFIIAFPLLYWCWDRRLAIYAGTIYLTAMTVNEILKYTFNNPRPDPEKLLPGIRELAARYRPNEPGFPSGHAQGSTIFWGTIAIMACNRAGKTLCIMLVILVMYSRLYLGVHYIGDVLGGLIIGILCLAALLPAAMIAERHYRSFNQALILIVILIVPAVISLIVSGEYTNKNMGAFSGFLIGALLAEDRVQFNPRNQITRQVAKIALGITVIMAIRYGLKFILPDTAAAGFFRYWCMGFWCSFGAPYLFGKFTALRGEVF